MKEKPVSTILPLAVGVVCAALLVWLWLDSRASARRTEALLKARREAANFKPVAPVTREPPRPAMTESAVKELLATLMSRLDRRDAREHEAVLTFKSAEAYQKFLARAGASGLKLLGQLDALKTVRVRFDANGALESELLANAGDYEGVGANPLVRVPTVPTKDDRAAVSSTPLGNNLLSFLGIDGDNSQYGRGVTIAILDTGISADSTLGSRVRTIDIGLGSTPGNGSEDGHGTAVASLAAGSAADAQGVAPASNLLSIRVTDTTGVSDIFTIAQAIIAATDNGARLINVSLGGYDTGSVLSQAIDYASKHGALIVASAGNDQAMQLTYPAADPRVVSVGAVDAREQQVTFSNSGAGLSLTAPGYGVQAAWLDNQRVLIDGTSASAPIVTGSLAAIMSANPALTAAQAWEQLQRYANDGGVPGPDPDYGNGIVNLGWAMNATAISRVDTAVSSHYYDAATGTMEFVVQNRGGTATTGLQLVVENGSATSSTILVPLLQPGASYVAKLPIDQAELTKNGGMAIRTTLVNPIGVVDQVPRNNVRASLLSPPATTGK